MAKKRKFRSDISEAMHSSAAALYKVGAIDKTTMLDFNARHLVAIEMAPSEMTASGKTFATAWDAISDSPEEAAVLKARADLMIALADHIKAQGWTQAEAAKRLGVTQPRISDLVRGKFNLFGLDHLAMMLARAGRQVEIRVKKAAPRKQAA